MGSANARHTISSDFNLIASSSSIPSLLRINRRPSTISTYASESLSTLTMPAERSAKRNLKAGSAASRQVSVRSCILIVT